MLGDPPEHTIATVPTLEPTTIMNAIIQGLWSLQLRMAYMGKQDAAQELYSFLNNPGTIPDPDHPELDVRPKNFDTFLLQRNLKRVLPFVFPEYFPHPESLEIFKIIVAYCHCCSDSNLPLFPTRVAFKQAVQKIILSLQQKMTLQQSEYLRASNRHPARSTMDATSKTLAANAGSIEQLPLDMQHAIYAYLPPSMQANLAQTNRLFLNAYKTMPLWKALGAQNESEFKSRLTSLDTALQPLIHQRKINLSMAEKINPYVNLLGNRGTRKILALFMIEAISEKDLTFLINSFKPELKLFNLLVGYICECRTCPSSLDENSDPQPLMTLAEALLFYAKTFEQNKDNLYVVQQLIQDIGHEPNFFHLILNNVLVSMTRQYKDIILEERTRYKACFNQEEFCRPNRLEP